MRNAHLWLRGLVMLGVLAGTTHVCLAQGALYDDFDDGDWDGWSVYNPWHDPADTLPPVLVPCGDGYAVRGTHDGYPAIASWLVHPVAMNGTDRLTLEMRARSGYSYPSMAVVTIIDGSGNYYAGYDYGENRFAGFQSRRDGQEYWHLSYPFENPNDYHVFKWTRDSDGWWSLTIDEGTPSEDVLTSFLQDNHLNTFDRVGIFCTSTLSEIDWVRVVPEPSTLSLLLLAGTAALKRRR